MEVKRGKKTPVIRQTAVDLTRFLHQKDWVGEIRKLFNFVKNQIRYIRDIKGVETLHTAQKVLSNGQGDCDDKAILLGSLLESIGHPTRFVAVGFKPGKFSHVFVETKLGKRWIGLETTQPVKMGWQPPNQVERMVIYN